MITKQVTLSTGTIVTVAPVPQKVFDVIQMQHPDPPVPVLEDNRTATGEPMRYENRKDPGYLAALAEARQTRQVKWAEAMLLFGLPEVGAPEGWSPPQEELVYISPDWKPREGRQGRRLDYIEWELLRNPGDFRRVIAALNELATVPEEAVDAIEATFQSDLEVPGEAGDSD